MCLIQVHGYACICVIQAHVCSTHVTSEDLRGQSSPSPCLTQCPLAITHMLPGVLLSLPPILSQLGLQTHYHSQPYMGPGGSSRILTLQGKGFLRWAISPAEG